MKDQAEINFRNRCARERADARFAKKYEAALAKREQEELEDEANANNAAYRRDNFRGYHAAGRITFSAVQVAMITTPTVTM